MNEVKGSVWREMLWPIYGKEHYKFIPMFLMIAVFLFNYTMVRIMKDALILTAEGSGAGVLNFLKGYVVMPLSILFVIFYSAMSNKFSKKNLFYVTLLPFVCFFAIFALVLQPFHDLIHPTHDALVYLQETYPRLKWIFPMYRYWSYTLFYVFAELWGNVAITLIFWQFANQYVSTSESKRFYPLFGALGNIGLIVAGILQRNQIEVETVCYLVVLAGFFVAGIHFWMCKNVLNKDEFLPQEQKQKKPKVKLSITESFKIVLSSKYLGFIAILVLAYGMTINMVEVTWKDQVKALYPKRANYQAFMSDFFIWTGIVSCLLGLTVKNVVRRFGWLISAMITPVVMMITSVLFYGFTIFSDSFGGLGLAVGLSPLVLAVIVGAVQNIASKGTKYSIFDPTKEMTYIPLNDDLKIKGKAAVDVVGGRMGKSLGGHIQSFLLFLTGGSQLSIAPILMFLVTSICFWWIYAVKKLSVSYKQALESDKE